MVKIYVMLIQICLCMVMIQIRSCFGDVWISTFVHFLLCFIKFLVNGDEEEQSMYLE